MWVCGRENDGCYSSSIIHFQRYVTHSMYIQYCKKAFVADPLQLSTLAKGKKKPPKRLSFISQLFG